MSAYDDDSYFQPSNTRNPEAVKYCPGRDPFITFAGRQWWINYHWTQRSGTWAGEPFNSIFDPGIIQLTDKGIRLQILPSNKPNECRTSELVLMDKLGYGKYLITVEADGGSFSDLDPNAIFGAFLYQYSEAPPSNGANIHREIDFLEVLRSGEGNAQFTLQPYDHNPHPVNFFKIPPKTEVITIYNHWHIDEGLNRASYFVCYSGRWSLGNLPPPEAAIASWMPSNHDGIKDLIPDHTSTSCERLHLNLWLMHGAAPSGPQSVTVTGFEFQP
ncbi:hypothetical protein GCM10007874_04390 [Labrys miyagiensis]|uniref:GH16 domain-containing protein n=1 Tax=Labrys miyagiensis TaxID=346912 RepID=A0ABQ6CB49_9HYPH|nr:hypothetical protein [Labrys miyagiensis]GLS17424.1 hypothetical protein GCM10007874_04390 [Labrys miyagiensis]